MARGARTYHRPWVRSSKGNPWQSVSQCRILLPRPETRVNDPTDFLIEPEVQLRLPGLRVHVSSFEGARIGLGHRGLDTLRARVLSRVRSTMESHRDAGLIPEVQAFEPLLLGSSGRADPPRHLSQLRSIARRLPMEVVNDAEDAAHLIALYYLCPTYLFDVGPLRPPLRLGFGKPGDVLPTISGGSIPCAGQTILRDRERVLAPLVSGPQRAPVTESTHDFLCCVIDPGVDGGIDAPLASHRIANWMTTLTGAQMIRCRTFPETR